MFGSPCSLWCSACDPRYTREVFDLKPTSVVSPDCIESGHGIPVLHNGHVTLDVECPDRLYLKGYIGPLSTSGGLVSFIREQLGKPITVAIGVEPDHGEVRAMAERQQIPVYDFSHKERKDDVANRFRQQRESVGMVFVAVGQEKAQTCQTLNPPEQQPAQ